VLRQPLKRAQQQTIIEAAQRALDYAHMRGVTLVAAAGCDLGSDEERASTERSREAMSGGDSGPARLADRLRRGG
jgi:hypothetical protein